jgi:hypothetical protein
MLRKIFFHLRQAPPQTFWHSMVACGKRINFRTNSTNNARLNLNLVREETHASVELGDYWHAASPLSSVALSFARASCHWC